MAAVTMRQTQRNTEEIEKIKEDNKILKKQVEILTRAVFKKDETPEIVI